MYLHIGNDIVIKSKNIIGIFDLESMNEKEGYKNIYENLLLNNKIINISNNSKTFILVKENKEIKGYITNISSTTLAKKRNSYKKK